MAAGFERNINGKVGCADDGDEKPQKNEKKSGKTAPVYACL
jgi:hypothetical protein